MKTPPDREPSTPEAPAPWRPRPNWGTVRDYFTVANDHGGTDIGFHFIPDDGTERIPITISDCEESVLSVMGEYARGKMDSETDLDIKVNAQMMKDAEALFERLNDMELVKRALIYSDHIDLAEDCGWAWTGEYKLVKVAPGLAG